jgi:hypothetical protein
MSGALTLVTAIAIMLAVVGAGMTWAVREQRRHNRTEGGHARDH